jgi:DNA-binding MarR family transcriptional regulator
MQTSRNATIERPAEDGALVEQAEHFEAHWSEVIRFLLNKKLRSSIYQGPEGELSHAELAAIDLLADRECRMSDLAARIGLSESSTTRLVDRLAASGLVERGTSPNDRRLVTASLTANGRETLARMRSARCDFLKEILVTLPVKERDELVRLFGRVADELRNRETAGEVRA